MLPQMSQTIRDPVSKKQEINPKYSQPKPTGSHHHVAYKKEKVPYGPKVKDFRIIIDTDEESDACIPCIPVKKETETETRLQNDDDITVKKKFKKNKGAITSEIFKDERFKGMFENKVS